MEIAPIAILDLRLNPHNDRHGALRDEASAVHWLLENRTLHMRALAIPLTLMDIDDLVETTVEYYEQLDLPTRTLIPLSRIYWPSE
jgi:predicted Mrr-cat superfamily restriction endonuclease